MPHYLSLSQHPNIRNAKQYCFNVQLHIWDFKVLALKRKLDLRQTWTWVDKFLLPQHRELTLSPQYNFIFQIKRKFQLCFFYLSQWVRNYFLVKQGDCINKNYTFHIQLHKEILLIESLHQSYQKDFLKCRSEATEYG